MSKLAEFLFESVLKRWSVSGFHSNIYIENLATDEISSLKNTSLVNLHTLAGVFYRFLEIV